MAAESATALDEGRDGGWNRERVSVVGVLGPDRQRTCVGLAGRVRRRSAAKVRGERVGGYWAITVRWMLHRRGVRGRYGQIRDGSAREGGE